MYKDILEDSWVYQETKLEGKLDALHQTIVKLVQARFPEMLTVTKKQTDSIKDVDVLQNLILQISLSQDIEEALQALLDVTKKA